MDDLQASISLASLKGVGEDRRVRKMESSGEYSVKSAYKWLRIVDVSGEESFYSKLWNRGALRSRSRLLCGNWLKTGSQLHKIWLGEM